MSDFSSNNSLGSKSLPSIAKYLEAIGDFEAAARFRGVGGAGQGLRHAFGSDVYAYTGMILGYIENASAASMIEVRDASTMSADNALMDSRIKITLDKFYVQSYPGRGRHNILCEFAGKNQIQGDPEELRFALSTRANDKGSAAVAGAPIFLGVSVGKNGISFEGKTVNVSSDEDDALLGALDSDAVKGGLSLLTSAQPALKPFVSLTTSVVKAVASRSKNKQIFSFQLGLDFGNGSTSARLRLGSYVVIQADVPSWDWSSYEWSSSLRAIVNKQTQETIPYNYLVFGVTQFHE
jgi:hypothetical protein